MIEKMNQYDAVIIGFGKGGKTLAAGLAERQDNGRSPWGGREKGCPD